MGMESSPLEIPTPLDLVDRITSAVGRTKTRRMSAELVEACMHLLALEGELRCGKATKIAHLFPTLQSALGAHDLPLALELLEQMRLVLIVSSLHRGVTLPMGRTGIRPDEPVGCSGKTIDAFSPIPIPTATATVVSSRSSAPAPSMARAS